MSTIDRRTRAEGRTTPARRPDGAGKSHGRALIAPSVQGWLLPHLITLVECRGADATPMRRLFGRTRLVDPSVRVAEAAAETAWRLAATLTGDEALGVHFAESLPRGALDLIEYSLRSSPSLGDGIDRLARYGCLLSDRVAVRTHRDERSLLFLVHDTATTPLYPARAEFALAMALKLARDCTGADITPLRVGFAHPAPDDTSEHRRFFHGRVRFAAGSSSMSLSAADAARPMRDADLALAGIIRRRLENALGARDRSSAGAMSTRVRRLLVEHLACARTQHIFFIRSCQRWFAPPSHADVVEYGSTVTATKVLTFERALFAGTRAVRSKRWDTSQVSRSRVGIHSATARYLAIAFSTCT